MRALFLNPLPPRRRAGSKKRGVAKKRRKAAKKQLTTWQRLVKKHKGNIKAAKKDYRRTSASGASVTSRRRAAGSSKRHKPTGKRKVVPVAKRARRTATRRRRPMKSRARSRLVKRRRRRAIIAPSVTWRRAVRRSTGKRVKARTTRKSSLSRWKRGMRKGLRGKGSRKWRSAVLRGVAAVNPRPKRRRRRKARRNPVAARRVVYRRAPRRARRSRSVARYRNPVSVAGVKASVQGLISKAAVKDYLYVTAGFVAGGILPGLVTRALFKAGVLKTAPSAVMNIGIGLGSAVIAGVGAGMITKDRNIAIKVAGGAVAGIVGALALRELEKRWPMVASASVAGFGGFGSSSSNAVRRGIEAEIRRSAGISGGGVGEFLTEDRIERELAGGMGAFVSQSIADDASLVSGFGAMAEEDIEDGTDTFDGGGF